MDSPLWPLFFQILGYIAAALTTLSFLPQAIKCLHSRNTEDISLGMYLLFVLGTACWLSYGLYRGDVPVVSANAITFVLASIILGLKIHNLPRERQEKAAREKGRKL